MSTLAWVLLILLLLSLVGGGLGHGSFGYMGWSPAVVLLIVFVVLLALGRL